MTLTTVPRLWPSETVVCIATGPSLRQSDVDAVRGRARVIVVNDAYQNKATSCLWADALYACDAKWWGWRKGAPEFAGLKYTLDHPVVPKPKVWPGVQVLRNLGTTGLSLDSSGLKTGRDSGYQAINLAVLFGASKIILLGYDMQGDHCFGSHPDKSRPNFHASLAAYPTLVAPIAAAGVSIVNCTRTTALTCFPRSDLVSTIGVEVAA